MTVNVPKNVLSIGGVTVPGTATFTRPADTNAYAALDAVSNSTSAPVVLTFPGMARINGGNGYVTKARLMTDQATNTARFRLHLYNSAPTPINDNAQQTLLWANNAIRVGYIDFDACASEGTGSDAATSLNTAVRLAFQCAAGATSLYGLLETLDVFTPASAQNFFLELTTEQN